VPADEQRAIEERGGALILAAGSSHRFGSDKRRFRLEGGTPMLIATLDRYAIVFKTITLVLREEDDELAEQALLAVPQLAIVRARHARLGMGHSLAAGIRSIPADWDYCCIGLADMPYIAPESLAVLRNTWLGGPPEGIIQPVWDHRPGHPVIFGACYFEEIGQLKGDQGARSVIGRHRQNLHTVAIDDPGVLADVDRPENARH